MKKTIIKALALTMACGGLVASSVQAASYKATGGASGSYTLAVGPGPSAVYKYEITSISGGSYTTQIKDPLLWYNCDTGSSASRISGGRKLTGGSKKAYWRGRIVNGWITVTV